MRLFKETPKEGSLTKRIEKTTARIPSDMFLWAAGGSILVSLGLRIFKRHHDSHLVGQWVPVFLALGIYNKLVKQRGHD